MERDADVLMANEKEQLTKLQKIVQKSIEDENLIVENLLHPPIETMTVGQKVSDKVARFGGSWSFIITFMVILIVWIAFNATLPKADQFDPFPFILMNLILSCIAALQAPIIMMSQNRQEEKDRKQNVNDYMINMKAEMEIKALHQKIDLLLEDEIRVLFDSQAKQLEMLKRIEEKINKI
ncbi:MAG: DUF1003 domain-containing protein [Saprospiraceae bacterium]|jgi:uncharacterized membrane protein|uniref:DUF1003 domain-containing protein n=1 Tax=Candidatus Brachybacter algidus TaxID=2982024 RepID=UPI001B7A7F14|nr:DUF1003 domain-containing protein [Candidatus Brachybacter algidus]MBP7306878.1 DUF1003 domain-containing protein [Saprospiraceae bacterium]MBK6375243.1 DUF1003 domain-containing protein [Candidatus Brachybacter algidus]MBK6449605.1 DUF1003 domain-containing protein [Candidatus Brachybacter algidus]MBK7604507.1 DUF1003 domain-containing protein [Candidatus Brachybacter algidus]MBK8355320.1 DUF1003 domain-containing protein [Candidatus Brachybacter algidus]